LGSDRRPDRGDETRPFADRFRATGEGPRRTQTGCNWFANGGHWYSGKCLRSDSVDPSRRAATLHSANKEEVMMNRLREWGVPVGFILL